MNSPVKLQPSVLIIFGITGDLAKRKVLPALYSLSRDRILHPDTRIVGISRKDITGDTILDSIRKSVELQGKPCEQAILDRLSQQLSTYRLDPLQGDDYAGLKKLLESYGRLDWLFYLAIPPQVYSPIIQLLGRYGLHLGHPDGQNLSRLLIEKPFGYDLDSAQQLAKNMNVVFKEQQIFRIDHYLAKETAQNILAFRRHNPVFASQWDGRHIRQIHVIAKEKIGIENRVNFYERVGAMRDLIQSHLLQLLALSAMDMPDQLDAQSVHAAKYRFLHSLIPPGTNAPIIQTVIRGQYAGYRKEVGNPESSTETFVSMVLKSRNRLWKNCRFQLTTGKALDRKSTLIQVYFGDQPSNILTFRLQPDEGIDVTFTIEHPGLNRALESVKMDFSYNQNTDSRDAYERVLVDALRNDHLLFATRQEVMTSWRLLQPVLNAWENNASDLVIYPNGSRGPDMTSFNRTQSLLN